MTRLIDADALCEEFKKRQRAALRWKEKAILYGDEERSIRADATLAFLSEVKLTIDNAPTVECTWIISGRRYGKREEALKYIRPQGEWIKEDKPYGNDFVLVNTCSICGESFIYHGTNANYCPNCGADMREADNDNKGMA